MGEAPQLDDLPPDALQHVLSQPLLCAADLAAVACTCSALRRAAEQDAPWQLQCEGWLAAQRAARPHDPALQALTPAALLAALRLEGSAAPAHRALRRFLHHLGGWPAGFWFATGGLALPQGHLLLVQLHPPSGGLRLARLRSRTAAAPPAGAEECWSADAVATLGATPAGGVHLAGGGGLQHAALQLALDGAGLKLLRDSARRPAVAPTPGWATLASQDAPAGDGGGSETSGSSGSGSGGSGSGSAASLFASMAGLTAHLGLRASRFSVQDNQQYSRAPLPAPADLAPAEGDPPGMALLRRCQGLFTGSYGPHGFEVLTLGVSSSEADVPAGCPIAGPRLQALKLVGDPNVMALKHSFVVDASSCRLGHYDPHGDDPFAAGGGVRPCLTFFNAAAVFVALEERPVAARFRAFGCINQVPGYWQPEWVPATFLVYDSPPASGASAGALPPAAAPGMCTIVFEDEGQPVRHAIDLLQMPSAATGWAAT